MKRPVSHPPTAAARHMIKSVEPAKRFDGQFNRFGNCLRLGGVARDAFYIIAQHGQRRVQIFRFQSVDDDVSPGGNKRLGGGESETGRPANNQDGFIFKHFGMLKINDEFQGLQPDYRW